MCSDSFVRRKDVFRGGETMRSGDIIALARQYGRYGDRKIAELLRSTAGWIVNDKRVDGSASSP